MYGPPPPPVPTTAITSGTVGVGRDDLVSGEAVALDLPPAGIGLRILSGLIDLLVGYLAWAGLRWLAIRAFGESDDALFIAINTLTVITALVVIPTALETYSRGKTLGHFVVGLRTVRDDAGPIGFRQALGRAMLGVIEIYGCLGAPAFLAAVCTRKGKRFGDLLAGTYVIRDRHRISLPEPPPMPPGLQPWAQFADIAPLPDPLAIAIRQFLGRREKMSPPARAMMADRLLTATAPFVAPAPPPGAPTEELLVAIMAERRRRDSERIARDENLRSRLLR
ncbi:RDD family protein [Gordonia soli]|uniref:RDD domain-containing protein n=1 Tax=Gordonia soli NBRC 108243 TaxID=1223545 RepID=M0QES1_9ACTN|nr:RDD family protein [Gordonia soli]GAC66816.1 hypothetical protein GS4_05_00240 [Gordonia soli NBRC 108243]